MNMAPRLRHKTCWSLLAPGWLVCLHVQLCKWHGNMHKWFTTRVHTRTYCILWIHPHTSIHYITFTFHAHLHLHAHLRARWKYSFTCSLIFVTLHNITLHYTTLHYITLHTCACVCVCACEHVGILACSCSCMVRLQVPPRPGHTASIC